MATEKVESNDVQKQPGEVIWAEGEKNIRPLLIRQGVVVYRRGTVAIGLLGPGQVALPVPGVPVGGTAAVDLVALTETRGTLLHPDDPIIPQRAAASSLAIIRGADRLGNMTLPQRLAALLLEVTDLTGVPVVGCRQDILAMAAAARRETVATILSAWREEEWIQTRYRRCKVLEREALEKIRDKGGRRSA